MKKVIRVLSMVMIMVTLLTVLPVSAFASGVYCKRDDEGRKVKEVQKYLVACGYSLVCDGAFGPKTESAVKKFQKKAGLSVTGEVNEKTLNALKKASKGKEDAWFKLDNYASRTDRLIVVDLSSQKCTVYKGRSGHWKKVGSVSCSVKGLKTLSKTLKEVGVSKFIKATGLKGKYADYIRELDTATKVIVQP